MSGNQLTTKFKIINKFALFIPSVFAAFFTIDAYAKDYMVEVLIFENEQASPATESHAYDAPKKMKSGSKAWVIEPSMLLEETEALGNSSEFEVKQHYSWGIESLQYEDSANYTILDDESRGYIKVYADQLLFTNIDLDYKGFRMKEKRRLKLNEKHFFDHPKFGLLMQVSRLPEEIDEDEIQGLGTSDLDPDDIVE